MAHEQTIHWKLSEISRLGLRQTQGFRALPSEQKRKVVERLDTVTADRLKAAVAEIKKGN